MVAPAIAPTAMPIAPAPLPEPPPAASTAPARVPPAEGPSAAALTPRFETNRSGELEVFVTVVARGGFSAAARHLGVTPSAVSKVVARLEARLGVQLLHRSTRRVETTAEGSRLFGEARRLLGELDALESTLTRQDQARGLVRINASTATGQQLLVPLVPRLMAAHPGLSLEISLTDRVVDLIETGADIAIRWGHLPPSGIVARLLGHTRQAILGSPAYFERHGRPTRPADLGSHVRIGWSFPRAVPHWPFEVDGQRLTQSIGEMLRVDDSEVMRKLAVQGAGLARLSVYHAWEDLQAGRLEAVLEDFNPGELEPIHAVYVGKPGQLPSRTRTVLDFLQAHVDLGHAGQSPARATPGCEGR